MFMPEVKQLLIYLIQRSWRLLLRRSWQHARASLRIYQALAEREPHAALRAALLQLAASQERRAALKAEHLRKLHVPLPEDRDSLDARIWRWLLVCCGLRWASSWIERTEDFYLSLSTAVMRLTEKVVARKAKTPH